MRGGTDLLVSLCDSYSRRRPQGSVACSRLLRVDEEDYSMPSP